MRFLRDSTGCEERKDKNQRKITQNASSLYQDDRTAALGLSPQAWSTIKSKTQLKVFDKHELVAVLIVDHLVHEIFSEQNSEAAGPQPLSVTLSEVS